MESGNSETQEQGSDGDLFGGRVAEEQIQQIFKQLPFVVVAGPLFGAVITALLLFDYVEPMRVYTVGYAGLCFLFVFSVSLGLASEIKYIKCQCE